MYFTVIAVCLRHVHVCTYLRACPTDEQYMDAYYVVYEQHILWPITFSPIDSNLPAIVDNYSGFFL